MKKIILTLGICMIALVTIQAQQTPAKSAPTLEQRVDKLLKTLTATCDLTPDQVTKAKPIVTETVKARLANRQKYGSDKSKLREANKATLMAENTKMNAILNADQQSKLAAFEKQREASAQQKRQSSSTGNQ